jgi:hypothetical protein
VILPNFYLKVVPINDRHIYFIGGSAVPDLKKPAPKEPQYSIFLVDFKLKKVVTQRKMKEYRNHAACAYHCGSSSIYIIGGQDLSKEWSTRATYFNINDKVLEEKLLPELPTRLFGPTVYIPKPDDKIPNLFVSGVNPDQPETTFVYKYSGQK